MRQCGRSAVSAPATDAELMAALARGEIGALGELYDRYQAAVRHFLVRATGDASDVDDLVHAAFLACAQSAARYDGRETCRPWLMGIVVCQLRRRRHAFGRWHSVLTALTLIKQVGANRRSELDDRTDIQKALGRLSEAKRVTLLLAEVEGLTGPEIASALGIPIGTVWTRLHAARRELRRFLREGSEP